MTSVALVGAGFGGVGAVAMLSRAGYRDVTVFERGERVRSMTCLINTQLPQSTP